MSIEGETVYTTVDDKGETTIEEDGHIDEDNIDSMNFTFAPGNDITESIMKKNEKTKKTVTYTKKGRIAYTPITCTYPDGVSQSSKVFFRNCIIQYTQALANAQYSYARNFVIIGIPLRYVEKIISDAKINSNINLGVKNGTQLMNNYYWLNCSLEKVKTSNINIVFGTKPDGSPDYANLPLDTLLRDYKKNMLAHVEFTISGSMTNQKMEDELELETGVYNISMKPINIFPKTKIDVEGPTLEDTNNRKTEKVGWTDDFVADSELIALAKKKLKITGGR